MHLFQLRTRLLMGEHALAGLGDELKSLGIGSVFVVTDPFIKNVGLVDLLTGYLRRAGIDHTLFTGVQTDPGEEDVQAAHRVFVHRAHDAVLALGGGSSIDTAKAVAILSANAGPLARHEGLDKINKPAIPVIAVPTTAGSGSEVTGACVLTDPQARCKRLIYSRQLFPQVVVLDPVLLSTVPPRVAAATGMDALTHAVEAYVSADATAITRALALEAISLIARYLPALVARGGNMQAAREMQQASVMAAMAYQGNRLTPVHAMADALSCHYQVPHGMANALLLPAVMEFYLIGCLDRLEDVARAMGRQCTERLSAYARARQAVQAVRELGRIIGLPSSLRQIGVAEDTLPALVRSVLAVGMEDCCPRSLEAEDLLHIYRAAMD